VFSRSEHPQRIIFKDTLRATNDSTILRIYTMNQRG